MNISRGLQHTRWADVCLQKPLWQMYNDYKRA